MEPERPGLWRNFVARKYPSVYIIGKQRNPLEPTSRYVRGAELH